MGCYDTILVPCPKCGDLYEAQSKSGDCLLQVYDFEDTPLDVMANVNRHAPFTCSNCRAVFHVEFNPEIKVVEIDDYGNALPSDNLIVFPEGASPNDIAEAFAEYQSKLDKK